MLIISPIQHCRGSKVGIDDDLFGNTVRLQEILGDRGDIVVQGESGRRHCIPKIWAHKPVSGGPVHGPIKLDDGWAEYMQTAPFTGQLDEIDVVMQESGRETFEAHMTTKYGAFGPSIPK